MEINGPTKRWARTVAFGAMFLSAIMFVAVLVPLPAAEASAFSGPCPRYSIQDVFADPAGNWDGDQVNNSDELYNGLNPCKVDTTQFCAGGSNSLCNYRTVTYSTYPSACQQSVNAFPGGDYDGDGISNDLEVSNGANPCRKPCPNPTNADLALNPNGSWDNDRESNAVEVSRGTNPCVGIIVNPCPHYTYAYVNAQPTLDWDRDGFSNATEIRLGTNPCVFNPVQRLPHVVQQTTTHVTQQQLPHVVQQTTTHVAQSTQHVIRPATTHVTATYGPRVVFVRPPTTTRTCPRNFPYYHPGNTLCYANPIGHVYQW